MIHVQWMAVTLSGQMRKADADSDLSASAAVETYDMSSLCTVGICAVSLLFRQGWVLARHRALGLQGTTLALTRLVVNPVPRAEAMSTVGSSPMQVWRLGMLCC